VRAVPRLC